MAEVTPAASKPSLWLGAIDGRSASKQGTVRSERPRAARGIQSAIGCSRRNFGPLGRVDKTKSTQSISNLGRSS